MSTLTTIVTVTTAAWVGFSAFATFTRASWVVDNFADYGVSERWWPWLGTAKAAGAVGLLAGLVVPAIGYAAAVGLLIYFTGAIITVLRARAFAHIPFPILYLAPVAAVAALGFTTG